jgi:hypothetical protein
MEKYSPAGPAPMQKIRIARSYAGLYGIRQAGAFCHRMSPDFSRLQLRNREKSGDLFNPKFFSTSFDI